MLRLPLMAHEAPSTIEEAVALLADDGAVLAAGGTDLLPNLKRRQYPAACTIVSLRRVAHLEGVHIDGNGTIRIGVLTTLADVAEDLRIPAAVRAASSDRGFSIRTRRGARARASDAISTAGRARARSAATGNRTSAAGRISSSTAPSFLSCMVPRITTRRSAGSAPSAAIDARMEAPL